MFVLKLSSCLHSNSKLFKWFRFRVHTISRRYTKGHTHTHTLTHTVYIRLKNPVHFLDGHVLLLSNFQTNPIGFDYVEAQSYTTTTSHKWLNSDPFLSLKHAWELPASNSEEKQEFLIHLFVFKFDCAGGPDKVLHCLLFTYAHTLRRPFTKELLSKHLVQEPERMQR